MDGPHGRRRWWLPLVVGIVVLLLSGALGYGLAQLVAAVASAPVPAVTLPPATATPQTAVETPSPSPEAPSESPSEAVSPSPSGSQTIHVVAAGEFLSQIAQKYGVSLQALIDANDIQNPDLVEVGQRLVIPLDPEASRPEETQSAAP
ncbi:MAG: LysM peptidoglycan-binding domain-containing protein [Candidatus Limnocylindrales bacterium]